jgi:hypothetical protein
MDRVRSGRTASRSALKGLRSASLEAKEKEKKL